MFRIFGFFFASAFRYFASIFWDFFFGTSAFGGGRGFRPPGVDHQVTYVY
jgi:hypothetical protein